MSAIVNSRHSRAADDPRLAHVSDDTSSHERVLDCPQLKNDENSRWRSSERPSQTRHEVFWHNHHINTCHSDPTLTGMKGESLTI
jgi:hypothetical protein